MISPYIQDFACLIADHANTTNTETNTKHYTFSQRKPSTSVHPARYPIHTPLKAEIKPAITISTHNLAKVISKKVQPTKTPQKQPEYTKRKGIPKETWNTLSL